MLKTQTYIELEDLTEAFDSKYHQNYLYDALNSSNHFYAWCERKGYKGLDPDGKRAGASQIWFKEYNKASDGSKMQPETLDFWKFAFDRYICDSSSSFFYFDPTYDLSGTPDWFKDIYQEICTTYSHLFKDGVVVVLNDW